MNDQGDIVAVLAIIGTGTARQSDIQARTGWDAQRVKDVLALMLKELHAKPSKTSGTGDVPWVSVDTVIARGAWTEADALAAIAKGELIADLIANIGSLDVVLGESDR